MEHLQSTMRLSILVFILVLVFSFFMAWTLLYSKTAHSAQSTPSACTLFFQSLQQSLRYPQYDSSIEIELKTTPEVLRLLTTSDGKISGLLRGKTLPSELSQSLKKQFPEFGNKLNRIPWDRIDPETQKKLIVHAHHEQTFWESRNLQGLIPKEVIRVYLKRPTFLFGKTYAAGWNDLPLREMIGRSPLDFTSPESLQYFETVEIHLRQKVNPSQNIEEAWALLDLLRVSASPAHQHIVENLSREKFTSRPLEESLRLVEFHRRINLYVEMLRILNGRPIETITDPNDPMNIYFDSLHQRELQDDFLNLVTSVKEQGETFDPRTYRNLAYVSLRLPGTYDGSDPIFGFEFRTLSKKDPIDIQEKMKKLMNATQYAITHLAYGIPEQTFYRWVKTQIPDDNASQSSLLNTLNESVAKLYYKEIPDYKLVAAILDEPKAGVVYDKLRQATQSNNAIPMLTHSWADDPLLYGAPAAQKQVREVQKKALSRISAGEKPAEALVYFLKKSGLFRVIENSLGIQQQTKNTAVSSHQSNKVDEAVGGN